MNGLVINPDPAFADKVRRLLEQEGCLAFVADVATGTEWLQSHRPDLLVVDLELLVTDGNVLLRTLQRYDTFPLVALTSATSNEQAREPGTSSLDAIRRVVRRVRDSEPRTKSIIRLGELLVDTPKRRAVFRDKRLLLTPIQFRLLRCLAERSGEVVDYQELLRQTWGHEGDDQEARELLKAHIRQIRRKMGLLAKDNEYLVSVRGFGYMLLDPEEDREQR